ncbi:MAG: HDIG domain-containing protein [Chitinispirillaceae bacterium]|nr:HDIG domain-containing protein [Chitinispirillaceae bacterium]
MNTTKQQERKKGVQARFWRRSRLRFMRLPRYLTPSVLVLVGVMCAVIALFPYSVSIESIDLPQVGEASKETIIAPFTFDVLKSPEEIDRERRKATEKVLLVLDYDSFRSRQMFSSLRLLRQKIALLTPKRQGDPTGREIHQELARQFSETTLRLFLKRPELVDQIVYTADSLIDKGILAAPIVSSKERLYELRLRYNASFGHYHLYNRQYVFLRRDSAEYMVPVDELRVREMAFEEVIHHYRQERRFSTETLNAVYELLAAFVHPNLSLSETETARRKREAAADVLATSGKVLKDTEIVRKHQEVTPGILQKLRSLHIAMEKMERVKERQKIVSGNAAKLVFILLLLLVVAIYLKTFHPQLVKNKKHLAAYATVLLFQLLVIRLSLILQPKLFEGSAELPLHQPEYFIPTAAGAVLAAILFGQELSIALILFVSIFFSIALNFNHYLFLYVLLGGLAAGLAARNIRYRWEYFKIIPPVLAVQFLCIMLWHLYSFKLSMVGIFQNFGLAVVNVGLSLFFAMTITPLLEYLFDVTTNMKLIELSDMNHPVLKRLSIEAAGTYNHSVLVGNLAESAAERIGANPLLARVASYYHDIGKIEKADYFVENALGPDKNRHNRLAPSMSALIILSHVKEGVELARTYKLPAVIQDVIAQHHGTSWVSFFYEKALEQDPHKQVQEQDFRYPGPPPQTRETAIIMLADSVEAASRSLGTSSPKMLRELVKKIIRNKFMDGQLDQCNLTLRDLDGIVEGFMPVLQGMFHSRITYPSQ